MNVNLINYKLNQDDNIIIYSALLNIEYDNKKELVVDVISKSVRFKDQMMPMTLWSSLSTNQKTTIIAGIFLIISSIIGSITAIYFKFKRDT
jgi:hypothetical protein